MEYPILTSSERHNQRLIQTFPTVLQDEIYQGGAFANDSNDQLDDKVGEAHDRHRQDLVLGVAPEPGAASRLPLRFIAALHHVSYKF